jgi:hypothetical protein
MAKAKVKRPTAPDQLQRFREMAREVGADEAPGALERAFGKLDPKKAATKPKRP